MKQFKILLLLLISVTTYQCSLSDYEGDPFVFDISGEVLGDESGQGLENVYIELIEIEKGPGSGLLGGSITGYINSEIIMSLYTDADGKYTIKHTHAQDQNKVEHEDYRISYQLRINNYPYSSTDNKNYLYETQEIDISPEDNIISTRLKGQSELNIVFEDIPVRFDYNLIKYKIINPIDSSEVDVFSNNIASVGDNENIKLYPSELIVQLRSFDFSDPTNEIVIDTLINFEEGKNHIITIPY